MTVAQDGMIWGNATITMELTSGDAGPGVLVFVDSDTGVSSCCGHLTPTEMRSLAAELVRWAEVEERAAVRRMRGEKLIGEP